MWISISQSASFEDQSAVCLTAVGLGMLALPQTLPQKDPWLALDERDNLP